MKKVYLNDTLIGEADNWDDVGILHIDHLVATLWEHLPSPRHGVSGRIGAFDLWCERKGLDHHTWVLRDDNTSEDEGSFRINV